MKIDMNLNDLTLGDLDEFETRVGRTVQDVFADPENIPVKALRALVLITKRRDDPSYTWEQTADIKVSELDLSGVESDTDPTNGSD